MADWKYCVVGNIVMERIDAEGNVRYGTAAFTGGTKVYLCRPYGDRTVSVIGLNRHKCRYVVENLPLSSIENFRRQQVYQPSILKIMDNFEFYMDWWGSSKTDRADTDEFVRFLNNPDAMKSDEAYKQLVRRMWRATWQSDS